MLWKSVINRVFRSSSSRCCVPAALLAVGSLGIALPPGSATAWAGTPCPADLNGDGVVDTDDLATLLGQFGCAGDCSADINGDGVVDTDDLAIMLGNFGCTEPIIGEGVKIFKFIPEAAGAGDLIKVIGENFDPNPKNHCLSAGGVIFEVEEVSPDGTNMLARVVAVPPGAQPAPMMVGLGDGDCSPTPLVFPFQTGGETFFWIGDPDDPLLNFTTPPDQLFTPIPDPTDSNNQTIFGTFVGGQLVIDLTGVTVQAGDKVSFFFRAWCPLRHPDINFVDQTFSVNLTGSLLANVLCANAEFAFQNPPFGPSIPQLQCDVNGAVMTISYTDCALNPNAPIAVVRVTR